MIQAVQGAMVATVSGISTIPVSFKQGTAFCIKITARPLATLSVRDIRPYTRAEEEVFSPIRSAVNPRLE